MTVPRVQPGQSVRDSAGDHNLIADAANAFAESRWGDSFSSRQRWRSHDLIRIENGTGADVAVGHALALTVPLTGPADDFAQFAARFNFLGDHSDGSICQFGVLVEPTPDAEIKYAAVSGIVAALVQVTDASHQFVCLPRNSTILRSAATGFSRILWKAGATGLQWCYVLLLGGSCCAPSSGSSGSSSSSSSSPSSSSGSSSSSPSSSSSGSLSSASSSGSSTIPSGDCEEIPTCTWWGQISEGGTKTWLAYTDLTMPQCRGIDPFPDLGCWCDEPDRDPAYDEEVAYTSCYKAV